MQKEIVRVLFTVPCLVGCAAQPSEPPAAAMTMPRVTSGDDVAGFLLGSPIAVTAETVPEIRLKDAGFDPVWTPAPNAPDFPAFPAQCFDTLLGVATPHPILAMSLGIDVIQITPQTLSTGQILDGVALTASMDVALADVSTVHSWMAFEFSVDSAFLGAEYVADPSLLAPDIAAAAVGGDLDRSVFCYQIPDEMESVRVLDGTALGLEDDQAIDALNIHMALYDTDLINDPTDYFQRKLPPDPWIYFTLNPDFLAQPGVDKVIQNRWQLSVLPDSGTVYRSHWDPTGRRWGTPETYKTWQNLGFNFAPIIDGLAVDTIPDASGSSSFEEILLSRRETDENHRVAAEDQIEYVMLKAGGDPPRPRRVVVLKGLPRQYRSLGRDFGGGRGIGDFCTADPEAARRQGKTGATLPQLLDDYFIARRLPPAWRLFLPRTVSLPGTKKIVFHRPRLGLAVSGFRQSSGDESFMRTCMSWPGSTTSKGKATLYWGRTTGISPGYLGPITWEPPIPMTYTGVPLVADHKVPALRPTATSPGLSGRQWLAAQWSLRVGTRTFVAPLSLLRL